VISVAEREIGTVTHYFGRIGVVAIRLADELKVGDTVHFEGPHTDFVQAVDSMQLDNQAIEVGSRGDEIAIKVKEKVRLTDKVSKVD
jgi:hypothetical protein